MESLALCVGLLLLMVYSRCCIRRIMPTWLLRSHLLLPTSQPCLLHTLGMLLQNLVLEGAQVTLYVQGQQTMNRQLVRTEKEGSVMIAELQEFISPPLSCWHSVNCHLR